MRRAAGEVGHVFDVADAQQRQRRRLRGWMLVRFAPGVRWLPLTRSDSADWQALRVALHAVRPAA